MRGRPDRRPRTRVPASAPADRWRPLLDATRNGPLHYAPPCGAKSMMTRQDIRDPRGRHAVTGTGHRRPARGHPGAGAAAPPGRRSTGAGPRHGRRPGPGGTGPGDRRPRTAGRRGGHPLRHRHRPQPGHLPGQGGGAEPAPPAAAGRPERARASRGRRSAPGGGGRGRDRPGRAARPRAGGGGGPRDRGGRHRHPGRGQAVDPGRSRGPAGQDAGPAPPRLPAGLAPRRAPDRALRPVLLALPTGAGSSPWTPAATSCSARPAPS
jgi:translation initiation factor IF-2